MIAKKGDTPILWIIIAAVLFLIALVVLGVIFGEGMKEFVKGTKDCSAKQGECLQDCPAEKQIFGADCPEGKICCLKT